MNIAQSILETVQKLPQDKAQQVLALAESLQKQEQEEKQERHKKAIAELKQMSGLYKVPSYTRDELYER